MLNKKVADILNAQVEKEAYSSHLYLAMASWTEGIGYDGITKWLYTQSFEERNHMLKIISYINERGGQVLIPALKQPVDKYESVKVMFQEILKHEQFISKSINDIVDLCNHELDYTTLNFIQWFVKEQIEEEHSAKVILDKMNLLGNASLYILDRDIMSLRSAS